MRRVVGSGAVAFEGAELLLALAGVPSGRVAGPFVLDARADSGCPEVARVLPGLWYEVQCLETIDDPAGPIRDGVALVGREPAPVPVEHFEAVRAVALREVARRAAESRGAPVDLGGVLHSCDADSREEWVYLAVGALLHKEMGSPPGFYDNLGYTSEDAKPVALPDLGAIASRYLGLLAAARERRIAALAAAAAVAAARDSTELVAALAAYPVTA